ncbi:MAG TPA: hypothetical protein V6D12_03865 [Candidatus Obscuribacterales bacterium]
MSSNHATASLAIGRQDVCPTQNPQQPFFVNAIAHPSPPKLKPD